MDDRHDDGDGLSSVRGADGRAFDFGGAYAQAYHVLMLIARAHVRDPVSAEDIVHEAAVSALGKADQFEPGTNFTAWLAQFVRYAAANHVRHERHRRAVPLDEAHEGRAVTPRLVLADGGQLPDGQDAFDDQVVSALEALSETARGCLLLRTVEGLSYAEIARVMDLPEGTAMSHVHRSRQALRRVLADQSRGGSG